MPVLFAERKYFYVGAFGFLSKNALTFMLKEVQVNSVGYYY